MFKRLFSISFSLIWAFTLVFVAACTDPARTPNPSAPGSEISPPEDKSLDTAVTEPGSTGGEYEGAPHEWAPRPEDALLNQGKASVTRAQILVMESFPPQYMLSLQGTLPTPCHQLRVKMAEPDAENRLQVEVYSVYNPAEICIQVIEEFEVQVPIENLPPGTYSIWVNEQNLGQIDVP